MQSGVRRPSLQCGLERRFRLPLSVGGVERAGELRRELRRILGATGQPLQLGWYVVGGHSVQSALECTQIRSRMRVRRVRAPFSSERLLQGCELWLEFFRKIIKFKIGRASCRERV